MSKTNKTSIKEKQKESITTIIESNKISILEHKILALEDKILRERAENENLRKRYEHQLTECHRYAIDKLALEIVSHIEDLNIALEKIKGLNVKEPFIKGLDLVRQNFVSGLSKFDICRVFPVGERFDFNFHEAISQIVSNVEKPGVVLEVIQAGYKIGSRVLKPARVVVSK